MPLPLSLDRALTDQLAEPGPGSDPAPASDPTVTLPAPGLVPRVRSVALGQLRRAVHRFRDSSGGRELVEPFVVERTEPIERKVGALHERVDALSAQVALLVAAAGQAAADGQRTAALEVALSAASTRIVELERLIADDAAPAQPVGPD